MMFNLFLCLTVSLTIFRGGYLEKTGMACRIISRRASGYFLKISNKLDSGTRCFSRSFASYDERIPSNQNIYVEIISRGGTSLNWPDTRLGPLEPKSHRFPLPGLVGSNSTDEPEKPTPTKSGPQYDADVLTAELPHERQSTILEQFVTVNHTVSKTKTENVVSPFDHFSYTTQECPFFLKRDFQHLFPQHDLMSLNLTVVTFYQKSNDTKFETSVTQFIEAATEMCEALHTSGFWADFIDPSSGKPYLSHPVSALSYEADQRYRRFGFEVLIHGGCRVLHHHQLGSESFIGCIVTTTPPHHPLLLQLHEPLG